MAKNVQILKTIFNCHQTFNKPAVEYIKAIQSTAVGAVSSLLSFQERGVVSLSSFKGDFDKTEWSKNKGGWPEGKRGGGGGGG